jgi:hypothetical protein
MGGTFKRELSRHSDDTCVGCSMRDHRGSRACDLAGLRCDVDDDAATAPDQMRRM